MSNAIPASDLKHRITLQKPIYSCNEMGGGLPPYGVIV